MNKYIIVNAETIQKRIDALKKPIAHYDGVYVSDEQKAECDALENILSNSKPLKPIIEDAFSAGMSYGIEQSIDYEKESPQPDLKTYINNLKLDI